MLANAQLKYLPWSVPDFECFQVSTLLPDMTRN